MYGRLQIARLYIEGLGYEPLLVLHGVIHGFHSVMFEGAYVEHLDRDALSRPKMPKGLFMRYVESMVFPMQFINY